MLFSDGYNLGWTAKLTFFMQFFFFLIAYFLQFDKLTDLAGASNFILLALLTYFNSTNPNDRMKVITSCTVLWGLRISCYLFYRILKTGKDDRFDKIRDKFFTFLKFWIFQMIWVWSVSLPTTLTNSSKVSGGAHTPFGTPFDLAGLFMFVTGLAFETISDYQRFRASGGKRGDRLAFFKGGLWRYSRHPNYFGEILLWWGVFFISLGGGNKGFLRWLSLASPLVTSSLLLFISGISLSEPKKDKTILESGNLAVKESYFDYINTTSPLIPLPPALYKRIPKVLKLYCLFEFPFYRFNPSKKVYSKHH